MPRARSALAAGSAGTARATHSRHAGSAAADHLLQLFGLHRAGDRVVVSDDALSIQIAETLVHRLHALVIAALDHRVDLVRLPFADQVPHSGSSHHDLEGAT